MRRQGHSRWSFALTWPDKGGGERGGGAQFRYLSEVYGYAGVLGKRVAGFELLQRWALIWYGEWRKEMSGCIVHRMKAWDSPCLWSQYTGGWGRRIAIWEVQAWPCHRRDESRGEERGGKRRGGRGRRKREGRERGRRKREGRKEEGREREEKENGGEGRVRNNFGSILLLFEEEYSKEIP